MKKIFLFIFSVILFTLIGCAKDGLPVGYKAVDDYSLQLLFEVEGHSVYRFSDAGHFVYFVLPGEADVKWQESIDGKNYYPMNVPTSK
jgi:hypothetical protein